MDWRLGVIEQKPPLKSQVGRFLYRLSQNLTARLLFVFVVSWGFGKHWPLAVVQSFYTFSVCFQEMLLFSLPFVVFTSFLKALEGQKKAASVHFLLRLLTLICLSNFASSWFSYGVGLVGLSYEHGATLQPISETIEPYFTLGLRPLPNEAGLLSAVILSLVQLWYPTPRLLGALRPFGDWMDWYLKHLVVPCLPLFACGFLLNMVRGDQLQHLLNHYLPMIGLLVLAALLYLSVLFGMAARFRVALWWSYLKNALPAGVMGFSTMSSLATMPVTLRCTLQSASRPAVARLVVPTTVNTHMIGDSLAIPLFAFAVLAGLEMPFPSVEQYLRFSGWFLLYRFAVAAVPGGSIIVMFPLLQEFLGVPASMGPLVTMMYVLFDPLITAVNVLGNCAFTYCSDRFLGRYLEE